MKKKLNKFFVSSTFVDMHQERDELLKKVFPAFREESNAHASEVEMIELRWGLDSKNLQDEALVSRVVGTCLSEIDRSRPFLLVYLSERWGWVPPRQFVPEELASKFHEDINGKSVTALEIDYALKEKSLDQEKDLELPRCIICLRDLSGAHIPDKLHDDYFEEDPDNRQKLKDLKEWLRETFNDSVIEYTAEFDPTKNQLGNFRVKDENQTPLADAILAKLKEKFQFEWAVYEKLPWQQRMLESARTFVSNRAESFVGRTRIVGELKYKLLDAQCIFLRGLPGSGKTSISCKVADDFRRAGQNVCFITCGTSTQNTRSEFILQQMIFFLEHEILKIDSSFYSTDYNKCKSYFFLLCEKISSNEHVYLFFDAIEQISDKKVQNLDFIPTTYKNIHCLVTCTNDYEIPAKFSNPAMSLQSIDKLDDENIKAIFRRDENAEDDVELEEITRKKLVKFFTLLMNLSETEATQLVEELSQKDLIQGAVDSFKQSPAMLNETMPFLIEDILELDSTEVVPVLKAMLDRKGKTLYPLTAEAVLNQKNSCNPLYLELIDMLLNMIMSDELLRPEIKKNANLITNLTVDMVNKMSHDHTPVAKYVLNKALEKLCINPSEIMELINLLAVSRYGLTVNNLLDLLGAENFKQLDWATLRRFLNNFFVERNDNHIDLAHNIIRASIRADISADEVARLEKKLGEYIEELAPEDSLRRTEGIYYSKLLSKYKFGAKLFAQAYRTKDQLLSTAIFSVLRDDDGVQFVVNCLEHINDEETAINAISFFIGDNFDQIIIGDSKKVAWQVAQKISATLLNIFDKEQRNTPIYQQIRSQLAMYELRLDDISNAKKIYEEIMQWADDNFDTVSQKQKLNTCRLLSTCCDQLAKFAAKEGDINKVQHFAEENVRWSNMALAIDDSPERDKYAILTAVKEIALEIRKNHGRATEEILELSRKAYELSKENFEKHTNWFDGVLLCKTCASFINFNVSLGRDEDALDVARQGLECVQTILQLDANSLESLKIATDLLKEIATAELYSFKFEQGVEHAKESIRLLSQVFSQNKTKEISDLLREMTEDLLATSYATYKEFYQIYDQDSSLEKMKRLVEATEAIVDLQYNARLGILLTKDYFAQLSDKQKKEKHCNMCCNDPR